MQKEKGKLEHSVKVPQLYKDASKILKRYENKEGSLKTLVYNGKYRKYQVMYGLLSKLIDNTATVKTAIAVSNLLVEQPNFDPHLAQVLTTQLMVKGSLAGHCKPILVFKEYEEKIKATAEKGFKIEKKQKDKDALPRYVRVNTLLGGMSRVQIQLEQDGFILENYDSSIESYDDFLQRVRNLAAPYYLIDYHIPDLLVFPPDTPFWNSVLYKKSVLILQDKASCLPVFLSSVGEMCNVIDACAAPGNKTSYIAAKMNNKGKVIAVERHQDRFKTMKKLMYFRETTCVKALHQDFFKLDPTDYCDVEYIFVDPSCSSSGTNVHEDQVSSQRIGSLAAVQMALLSYALSFPSVKEVIYSTCSVYEEENEIVVDETLMRYHKDFELADLGAELQGWKHFGNPKYKCGHKCLRTNVEIDRCTGFFVAKFVRKDKSKRKKDKKRKSHESLSSAETAEEGDDVICNISSSETAPKKKKRKQKVSEDAFMTGENTEIEIQKIDDEENSLNLQVNGTGKKKKKKSKKVKEIEEDGNAIMSAAIDNNEDSLNLQASGTGKKKKKKSKKVEIEDGNTSISAVEEVSEVHSGDFTDEKTDIEIQEIESNNDIAKLNSPKKRKKSKK